MSLKRFYFQIPVFCIGIFLLSSCKGTEREAKHGTDIYIEQNVDAEDFFYEMTNNPALTRNSTGEPFAWHACNGADQFVKGYKAWHDTCWLSNAVKYYQFLFDHMTTAPDGYRGFIGKNNRHELWSNEQVSDALAINPMLEFSGLVLEDPELRKLYGHHANSYIEFAKKHVIEKWDFRNLWHEEGEYGNYIFGSDFMDLEDLTRWVMDTLWRHAGMSQKFNIANKLGVTNLRLYRLTGDEFYRAKAEKLFYRLKSNFQLIDDHYVWNYWVPYYEKDIIFDKNDLIFWTAVHPFRAGYKSSEVKQVVESYHTGVVFSQTDMERIITTNMDVMWNQDTANPLFINSRGVMPDTSGMDDFLKAFKSGNKLRNMGQLWPALIDFDVRARLLYETQIKNPVSNKEKISQAYYYNVIRPEGPDLKRKYAKDLKVKIKDVPLGNSNEITVATVIPYIITEGENSFIITKSAVSGPLEISLYSVDGREKLKILYKGDITGGTDGHHGFRMIRWDGTDPDNIEKYSGAYLIRWIFEDGHRDYAIRITTTQRSLSN